MTAYFVTCTRSCYMKIEADSAKEAEEIARNRDWDDEPQEWEVVVDED